MKTVGTVLNYVELEGKNPVGDMEARYSPITGKYRITTKLTLKGRGITLNMQYNKENCTNSKKYGFNVYHVTKAAFQKLETQYLIVQEILFD